MSNEERIAALEKKLLEYEKRFEEQRKQFEMEKNEQIGQYNRQFEIYQKNYDEAIAANTGLSQQNDKLVAQLDYISGNKSNVTSFFDICKESAKNRGRELNFDDDGAIISNKRHKLDSNGQTKAAEESNGNNANDEMETDGGSDDRKDKNSSGEADAPKEIGVNDVENNDKQSKGGGGNDDKNGGHTSTGGFTPFGNSINAGNMIQVTYKPDKKAKANMVKPIHVQCAKGGFEALNAVLQRGVGRGNFTIDQRTGPNVKIFPKNENTAKAVVELLNEKQYGHHTFKKSGERKKAYLLKGLHEIDVDIVRKSLIAAGLPQNTTVKNYQSGHQKKFPELHHKKFYMVVVDGSVNEKIIERIDSIYGVKISMEKMKSTGAVQCKNCQQYHHTAGSCNHNYRCVKCTEKHLPGKCKLNENPNIQVKCVLCNGPHTANNRNECEYYKKKVAPFVSAKTNKAREEDKKKWSEIVATNQGASGSKMATENKNEKKFATVKTNVKSTPNVRVSPSTNGKNSDTNIDFASLIGTFTQAIENQNKMILLLFDKLNANNNV